MSAFTEDQVAQLRAPLAGEHVREREQAGRKVSYIEGWVVIAEANRIFGFDAWDRETVECKCVTEAEAKIGRPPNQRDGWRVAYIARVRVTVRPANQTDRAWWVRREGSGYGSGIDADLGSAHESAIKEAECVPLSTTILTQEGFKRHEAIGPGDIVAGYDLARGHLVWTPVLDVVRYGDAPVVRVHNHRSFEVFCTPSHDWVALRRGGAAKRAFRDMNAADAILCAAPMLDAGTLPASPEEAARVGFAICDGTFHRTTKGAFCRFAVYQSKPETVAWCREMYGPFANERERPVAVGETPTGHSRAGNHPAFVWEVAAAHSQAWLRACGVTEPDQLPKTVARLAPKARRAMLDALMAADGDKRGSFGKKRKPWVMDVFRILCALEGIYTGVTRTTAAGMPAVRQQKTPVVTAWNCRSEDAGRMDVWCPKTGTGTWVAQFENGVTCITGNTDAMKRALMTFGNPFGLALYDKAKTEVAPIAPKRAPAPAGARNAPSPPNGAMNGKTAVAARETGLPALNPEEPPEIGEARAEMKRLVREFRSAITVEEITHEQRGIWARNPETIQKIIKHGGAVALAKLHEASQARVDELMASPAERAAQ